MKRIGLAVLFIAICLAGILFGGYTYLGTSGTQRTRKDSVARGVFLKDPAFTYPRQYPTKADLAGASASIAPQYEEAARAGYALAKQGDWDKKAMAVQSILLLVAGAAGLFALKTPDPRTE